MADNSKQYKEAMKNLDNLVKKQEALNKSTDALKNSWGAISSEVFKMDGANWFKKVPLAVEDIKKLNDEIKNIESELKVLEGAFNDALDNDENFKKLSDNSGTFFKEYQDKIKDLDKNSREYYVKQMEAEKELADQIRKSHKEFAGMSDEDLKKVTEHLAVGGKLSDVYDELSDASKNLLKSGAKNAKAMVDFENAAKDSIPVLDKLNKELADGNKEVFSIKEGLMSWSNVVMKQGIAGLMQFDKTLNEVQKNTGINMDDNARSFGDLTGRVAQYGMSIEKAGEMMTQMSDELHTTNFSVLSKAAEDFASIEGATGASSKEITTISGQLMRMGESSKQVKDYFEDASKMAQKFGVSSKKAIEGISKNITKMRAMGFTGGEKSLAKMVVTAEKLNMNVDEIFDVAKKARSIEGAMEMASELQLAGGSFANINPMDLLSAARKGPEELQKILTSMGKDVGKFNKETGKYDFDPVDVDRLQMVADATGQSLDSIMNGIQKSGLDKEKLDPFSGMMDGMDEADKALAQSSLGDMLKFDQESGTFKIDADNDLAKKMGIDSLDDINEDTIKQMAIRKKDDAKTLEEQNKRNQSFQEALTNFWNALQSIFSVFEPVLTALTTAMQFLSKMFGGMPGWAKYLVGGLVIAFALFGTSVGAFITQGIGTFAKSIGSFGKSIGGLFKEGGMKGLGAKLKGKFMGAAPPQKKVEKQVKNVKGPKPGVGGGLKSLAEGLKAMGSDNSIFKGILAVAAAGPAFLLFVPALPGLLVMGLIGTMGKSVTAGFKAVADGLIAFGSDKNIFSGILAILASSVPLLLFTLALPGLLAMALVGVLAVPIEAGFRAIATGVGLMGDNMGSILKGALAMGIIGLSLIPFAFALSMMTDVSWEAVLASLLFMVVAAGIVVAMGMLLAGPQALLLLAGAAAMLIIAGALLVFALAMQQMAPVMAAMQGADFSWMSSLGWALLEASPGLFLGGLALLVATPGLVFGAVGIMAIANAAMVATAVDWNVIANMGNALMSAVPGLLSFAFASLLFVNPISMLGMMAMVWIIGELAAVMTPLAQALTIGGDSLNGFAEGLQKLSAAADSLSDEKLERLQKISEAMASASAAGNIGSVMAAVAGGAGGGAGGGAQGKVTMEVNLKLNGREIQNLTQKDVPIVTG